MVHTAQTPSGALLCSRYCWVHYRFPCTDLHEMLSLPSSKCFDFSFFTCWSLYLSLLRVPLDLGVLPPFHFISMKG